MKHTVRQHFILFLILFFAGNIFAQNIATIAGTKVTINNGVVLAEINGGRMTSLNLKNGKNLLNGGYGYFTFVNDSSSVSPSAIAPTVKVNNADIADIYFRMVAGFNLEMHYVFRKNESGFYTYYVIADAGVPEKTVNSVRFALRVDKSVFNYAWTVSREGAMIYPDILANSVQEIQDATYLLQDGTIYTKYDWAVDKMFDMLHGLMGNGAGIWNIEASHEYVNSGTTAQELTLHGTDTTPIMLSQFFSAHYGGSLISLRDEYQSWKKIFGPVFIYLNAGTNAGILADAKQKANEMKARWPYQWLNSELYPLERGSLSGKLKMTGHGDVDSAMVLLCKSGPSWLQGNDHWQYQPYDYFFWTEASASGEFVIDKIRPGTYTLYAYTQKGKLIDEMRKDNIVVNPGDNQAGTIAWDAHDKQKTIFQLGTADHKSAEFKLADLPRLYGRWKDCPLTLTYDTQTDSPRNDWYYCQRENSLWNIRFDVDDVSSLINPTIKVAVSGSDANPHLDLILNGNTIYSYQFGTDSGIRRGSPTGGKYTLLSCSVNKSFLNKGTNTLSLRCYGTASEFKGIMYDAVLLESDTIKTSSANEITSISPNKGLTIYPNPSNDILNIRSDENIQSVRILDLTGKTVFVCPITEMKNTVDVDISAQQAGFYFVQVEAGKNMCIQKQLIK